MPKFRDIPKVTSWGSYCVNVPLHRVLDNLEDFSDKHTRLDMNPDFQRVHVWTDDQQSRWLEHLLQHGRGGRDILFNHPNWLGRSPTADHDHMILVDGKQRLEAIRRFYADEVLVFGYKRSEFEDEPRDMMTMLNFHVNNLATRAEVLKWYIDLNSGGTVHTEEEITRVRKLLEQETKNG